MNIQTKYDIGDEVYYFNDGNITLETIHLVNAVRTEFDQVNLYSFDGGYASIQENDIFKTTKELYKHIEKEIKKLEKEK